VSKLDREQTLAKTALDVMSQCGVAPTPQNFELFYLHVSRGNEAVSKTILDAMAQKKPFTPELLQDLYARAHGVPAIDQVGNGMHNVITGVLGSLSNAGRDAGEYSSALLAATGVLGSERSPADLKKLVNGLLAATRQMEKRTKSLEDELHKSSSQVHELRSTLDTVRKESLTDPLTHIGNRKAFDLALASAEKLAEQGETVSLLLCDIDHFKKFNDSWGHQTGDQVLRVVANCLSENIKGRDTAARYGGEEFGLVLKGASLEGAVMLAEQIRQSVEGHRLVKKSTGDVLGTMTISIGVAQFAANEKAENVLRRADACLYGAKRNGRNLVIAETDSRMASLSTNAA
jgi:diguanylate cyclase